MTLSPITERFVLHWGEMGSRWGVNRTVAQIHALLFVLGKPLTAEDMADALGVARSNVSNSLRELGNWNLVRMTYVMAASKACHDGVCEVAESGSPKK